MPTPEQARVELRRRVAQVELDRRAAQTKPTFVGGQGMFESGQGGEFRGHGVGGSWEKPRGRLAETGVAIARTFTDEAKGLVGTAEDFIRTPLQFTAAIMPGLDPKERAKQIKAVGELTSPLRTAESRIGSAEGKLQPTLGGTEGWIINTLGSGVTQSGISLALAGTGEGLPATMLNMFAVSRQKALDEGASLVEAGLTGISEAALETWGVSNLIKFKDVGKGSLKSLIKNVVKGLRKEAGNDLKNITTTMLKSALVEGLEETSQGGAEIIIDAIFPGGKDIPRNKDGSVDYGAIAWQLVEQGAGGALVGGFMGGTFTGLPGKPGVSETTEPDTGITQEEEIPPGSNVYETAEGRRVIETPSDIGDRASQKTELRDGKVVDKETGEELTQVTEGTVSGIQDAPMGEIPAETTAKTPAAPEQVVGPTVGTPITKQEKDALREQGFSVIDILNMDPSEARGLLGIEETPAPVKPPRQSKTTLRAVGHKIARESNVSDEDYRDYAEVVTGKRSMKDMTRKEMEEFVVALEESFGSPTELTQEDFETPITVAGRGTTMGSVYRNAVTAVNKLAPKRTVPDRVKMGHGKPGKLHTLKNFFFGIDNTPVYHLARILDGATNGIFSEVFDKGIQLGTKITDSHKRSTFGILRAQLEDAGVTDDDLAKMGKAVNPRLKTDQMIRESAATEILVEKINDREYEMTWANLIDIYLMANQEAGLKHLQEGGLVINGVETGALSDDWILDTMMKVEKNEKAKAVADAILKVGSDIWAPSLNQVSNRLEDKDIATVENWWGFEVYMPKRLKGKQRTGISLTIPKGINLIEDKGILKDRTRSGAALVVRDAFSRFAVFEDAVAEYVGMAEPTRTTRTLLNNPGITKILKQKGYDDVLNNIRRIHETAQSVRPNEGGLTAFVERHLPALYRAALHANPPVIVSQATSTFNYGAYASPEFMASVKDGLSIQLCKETLALSDVAWARFHMGQSSLELGEMAKSDAALRLWTNKSADINKLGWGLKIGDLVALTGGMSVAQAEYQKALKGELKGLSAEWWTEKNDLPEVDVEMWRRITEEGENADPQERQAVEVWKQTVSERAEYLWQRTQPSWDKWNRSVITSQRGIARTFLLFRSFQEKCLTIFNEAKLDYDNSPKSLADKTLFVQKTGSVLASYTVNMTLRLAILAAMTRKIKEPLDYLQDMLTSWMGMFPVFGKVLETSARTFIAALTGTKPTYKGEALESYPVSIFNMALKTPVDFTAAVGHFISGDNDKAETSFLKGMDDIFKGVGAIYGVPVYQIKRIMPKAGEEKTSAPSRRRVTPPVRKRP